MSIETVPDADLVDNDQLAVVIHGRFPNHSLGGYVILPPHELRTKPQGPWVSVDHHTEGADWVYAVGATRRSYCSTVELDISEVS